MYIQTSCNWAGVYPSPPTQPNPPAFETAAASGPPEARAIPARMMGYLIPSALHSGVERVRSDMVGKSKWVVQGEFVFCGIPSTGETRK
jgi:hypothetical protein